MHLAVRDEKLVKPPALFFSAADIAAANQLVW
jgi:hypothetical protein